MKEVINWEAESTVKKADIIFYNGTIYTMEDQTPICDAMSIINDRILAVGNEIAVMKQRGPNTKVIDLNGRTLVPGFIDAHIHMAFCSMKHWTELSPFLFKNMDEVYNKIVQTVKDTP
jgi:predicted amidohydrolase YtcJ